MRHPRNVGSFEKGDETVGTGMVGAPACGDVMKLQIKVNPSHRRDRGRTLQDLRLRLGDCLQSSLVTEWVKGKTLDEAASAQEQRRSLKSWRLPPVKIHCSILAEDAIKAAVNDYKQETRASCCGVSCSRQRELIFG